MTMRHNHQLFRQLLPAAFMLLTAATCIAQQDSARYAKYWVQFTNKHQSPYSVERPEEFLSPAAIGRRQRAGIAVTPEDFPVNPEYVRRVLALDTAMRVMNRSRWLNGITVYSAQPDIAERIQALGCVIYCERTVTLKQPEPDSTPYEYMPYPVRYGHLYPDAGYGLSSEQLRLNNAHWLHRMGYHGEGIMLTVLDGGFQNADTLRHFRHLRESGRLKAVRNFAQPYADPFRDGRHGTYVLSWPRIQNVPDGWPGSVPLTRHGLSSARRRWKKLSRLSTGRKKAAKAGLMSLS